MAELIFFSQQLNLRGCGGVAATGGTRRAHHFHARKRDFTASGFQFHHVGAQYSVLSPVTTSCVQIG